MSIAQSFRNFAQSTAMILQCPVFICVQEAFGVMSFIVKSVQGNFDDMFETQTITQYIPNVRMFCYGWS